MSRAPRTDIDGWDDPDDADDGDDDGFDPV